MDEVTPFWERPEFDKFAQDLRAAYFGDSLQRLMTPWERSVESVKEDWRNVALEAYKQLVG